MNEPLLSLIVPVYNVAPYLRRCLDSLLAQTRPVEEIIVVDDGSTDNCPAILAEYAALAPQLRVIRQENGGLSAARNAGMAVASGRYIAFIDSDDFVVPQMYEQLLRMACLEDLDIAMCNANYHFEGREADRPIYTIVEASGVIRGSDWLRQRLQQKRLMHMVWMHLYRRTFIVEHGFSFVPRLIHEDVIWTTRVLLSAERVRYDPTPLYNYRIPIRRFSEEQNRRRLEAIISSSIVNAQTLIALSADDSVDVQLKELLRWQAVDGAFSIFHKLDKLPDASWRRARYREMVAKGLFPMLWKSAVNWQQKRRLARNYLRALLAGGVHG